MKKIEWDLMKPQDIEIRPAQIRDGKVTLLLYQNSRTAMDALDRNFGEFGWKMEYRDVAGQIYGRLSILDPETHEWVYKEDTGDESNISAQKGQSSDILKRCAVRFGYGRELYTAPRIVIPDDGYGCSGYKVSHIEYNDRREIIRLRIVNRFDKVVFDYAEDGIVIPQNKPVQTQQAPQTTNTTSMDNVSILRGFCSKKKKEETDKDDLLRFFNFYKERVNGWTNVIKPEILWNKWQETRRKT